MFKTIMLATDGSKLSQKAVKSAIDLAGKFSAELVAVKVIPRYVQTYFEGSFTVADIDVKSIEAQWAAGAQVVLDKNRIQRCCQRPDHQDVSGEVR